MELTLTLASRLISMMIYVAVGFIIVRAGILKTSDSKPMTALVVWVLQPCLIVNAFLIDITPERMRGFWACMIFSFIVYILWILLTWILKKPLLLDPIDQATLVYSNVGNLVLPLVSMILGPEMVFYGSAIQVGFNLFIWTHGASTIRGTTHIQLRKILLNTNIIALAIGLLCVFFRIQIPEIIATSISGFTSMVGPMSMLVVGMVIADSRLLDVFRFKKAYKILFGRLIVYPALMLALLYASGFLQRHPAYTSPLLVTVMSFCAPPAVTVSQMAVLYDQEPLESSIYNVMGIFLCILTMPLVIFVYQALFL